MEIANPSQDAARRASRVRPAVAEDQSQLNRLLRTAVHAHLHVDWQLPGEWLGQPGFVVMENRRARAGAADLLACLAATADPLPAAWVRVAALDPTISPAEALAQMVPQVLPALRRRGAIELGWLALLPWANEWLPQLGFSCVNHVVTYLKDDLALPPLPPVKPAIRPVRAEDMPLLAQIEAAAFEPLWRHSAQALALAWRQAISFDVALWGGRIVAFQYSAPGENSAHLCRITVHPAFQGQGVATTLLAHALTGYRQRGLRRVSLNTQVDNWPSRRLYEKFGFYASGVRYPVWRLPL